MEEPSFRFDNMQVGKRAADLTGNLFKMSEKLDERRYYKFSEQLRAATLSITNNIAEGSGSASDVDFANFLNTARRSLFEVANMLIIFTREKYLAAAETSVIMPELVEQSRMLHAFRQSLKRS